MRLLISWLLNTLAMLLTSYLVPGFEVANIATALIASVVLGVINTIVKPVLVLLTFPLTVLTLGLFLFVVNAIALWLAAAVVPGMHIDGWWSAIIAAAILSLISTILSSMTGDNND